MKNLFPSTLLSLFLLFISLQACSQKQGGYLNRISADSLYSLLKGKHGVLLDVRTPGEFKKGHIKGALNIDFLDDNFSSRIDSLDKNVQYEVYCHSGGRSGEATELMQKKGFKKLLDLDGGISRWQQKGYPTEK
jgi:rhodanese-related sulfurtransferase